MHHLESCENCIPRRIRSEKQPRCSFLPGSRFVSWDGMILTNIRSTTIVCTKTTSSWVIIGSDSHRADCWTKTFSSDANCLMRAMGGCPFGCLHRYRLFLFGGPDVFHPVKTAFMAKKNSKLAGQPLVPRRWQVVLGWRIPAEAETMRSPTMQWGQHQSSVTVFPIRHKCHTSTTT